jgi:hypothetical protein
VTAGRCAPAEIYIQLGFWPCSKRHASRFKELFQSSMSVPSRPLARLRLTVENRLQPLRERMREFWLESSNMASIEKFQVGVGIIVSLATLAIGLKTFELNELTQQNNRQL